jgi:hypothetical protein
MIVFVEEHRCHALLLQLLCVRCGCHMRVHLTLH